MSGVADIVELEEERSKRTPLTDAEFDSAGDMLRAAREARGLSIEEVSDATNVRTDYLIAIEGMQIDRLPIPAYTTGFVKAYSQFLELPVDPLVQRFRKEAGYGAGHHIAPEVAIPTTNELRGGRELSLLAVVAIVAFIIWVAFQITRPPRDIGPVEITGTPLQSRPIEEPEVAFTSENEKPAVPGETVTTGTGEAAVEAGDVAQRAAEAEATPDGQTADSQSAGDTAADTTAEEAATDEAAIEYVPRLKDPAEEAVAEPEVTDLPLAETVVPEETAPVDEVELTPADALNTAAAVEATEDLNSQLLNELEASLAEEVPAANNPAPVVQQPPAQLEIVVTEAQPTRRVPPVYPRRCESRAGTSETVTVIFDVTSRGTTANARVSSSTNGCFDRSALNAIARWEFQPATRDGVAEPTYGRSTRFNFQLPE